MRTTKRLLSILLALVIVLGLLPSMAFATDIEALLEGEVYISISDDESFITDADGNPMGFVAVPLEELLFIDLANYGLESYIYDADMDNIPEITALHLYIYVHEFLLGLDWSDVYITGGPGSIYLAGGLFGFIDENLRYDLNGAYPAVNGWGLTADQIVLSDGDFLNVAHYTDWSFWGDSATGFHYFTDPKGNLQHTYQALVGEPLELGFVRSYSDWNNGGLPAFDPEIGYEIYYGKTYGNPEGSVYSDEEGMLEITFPSAGTWYVWADGGYGAENDLAIVSAPGIATVKVPDLQFSLDLSELTDPIYDGGMITYNLNETDFAYLDDTCEAGDNVKYGFSVSDYDQYILYVDFYANSSIVGWNVNGVNYFADDPGEGYVDWDLGNDCWAGYGFGYTDEDTDKEYIEFYLQLGSESAYNTAGSWDIKPVLLTDKVLEAIDAIFTIYDNGEITLESGEAIRNAADLYEALSDMEKEVLDYLDPEIIEMLEEAQETYNTLLGDREAADTVYCHSYDVSNLGQIYPETQTGCINANCVDLAEQLISCGYRPAILNLASAKKPGGGYRDGLGAQEESLCRSSNLSLSLYQYGDPKYIYIRESGVPSKSIGYPLDRNFGGIYTPNATFFRNNKSKFFTIRDTAFKCDIITVAALSFNGRADFSGVDELIYRSSDGGFTPGGEEIMLNKIRTIFRMGVWALHFRNSLIQKNDMTTNCLSHFLNSHRNRRNF